MTDTNFKRASRAFSLSGLLLLTACGGGGGSSDPAPVTSTPPAGTAAMIVGKSASGALDTLQTQVTDTVVEPLSTAVSGTALQTVLVCSNEIVVGGSVDIAETILASLQGAGANPGAADPALVAGSLRGMVVDLVQLLEGLAGQTVDCAQDTLSIKRLQNVLNLLYNTPLAPLAERLQPIMTRIIEVVGTDGTETPVPMTELASLVDQLNSAMQLALSQIPDSAYEAPIVGGALTTVGSAIADTSSLLSAAARFDAPGAGAAVQNLVNNALVNLLTKVIPLSNLEAASGQVSPVATQITESSAKLSALLGNSVGKVLDPLFNSKLGSALSAVLAPVSNALLPAIVGPIMDGLAGGADQTDTGGKLAGTVLAPVVNIVDRVLGALTGQASGGTSGGGTTGTPTKVCAFANIPLLSILCPKG